MKIKTHIYIDSNLKSEIRSILGKDSMSAYFEKLAKQDISRDRTRECIKYLKDRGYKVEKI